MMPRTYDNKVVGAAVPFHMPLDQVRIGNAVGVDEDEDIGVAMQRTHVAGSACSVADVVLPHDGHLKLIHQQGEGSGNIFFGSVVGNYDFEQFFRVGTGDKTADRAVE